MTWEAIPDSEMSRVLDAVASGGCVVCFEATGPGHSLYCHEHDDGCGDGCEAAKEHPSPATVLTEYAATKDGEARTMLQAAAAVEASK